MMTTTKKRPPLFNLEDLQRSREQDQTAHRILDDCDRRAGVWTGQPEEPTPQPWQGWAETWKDYGATQTPRCKSCGNPRDLLDLYDEPICNPCALVLVLGHPAATFRPVLPPHPTCPWIASLKADEV